MAKIQMPDDFYDQTPDANVLATEAVMNTIRTADMLFDQIGRLLRPLNVSAAGGLVLGDPPRSRTDVTLGAQRPTHRHPRHRHRRGRLTESSAATSVARQIRPIAGACWSRSRRQGSRS